MEETIWIIVGIIAVLITFGILVGFARDHTIQQKQSAASEAVTALANMCNRMCKMPPNSYLSTSVNLPSGSTLNTTENIICLEIGDYLKCQMCDCIINPEFNFDLSSPEAVKLFTTHKYECYFLKNKDDVSLETCKG